MPGGPVDLLSFNFLAGQTTTDQSWSDFKLYVIHTDVTSLSTNYADNYSGNTPQLAYSKGTMTLSTVSGEWFGWEFDPPIPYDGTSNLIFELTYVNPKGSVSVKIGNGTNRCLFATDANAQTGDFLGNDQAMRIYYEPNTGIGDRKNKVNRDMKLRVTGKSISASLPSRVNNKDISVAIYTMAGKMVYSRTLDACGRSIVCDISHLPAGIYSFVAVYEGAQFMQKFYITR